MICVSKIENCIFDQIWWGENIISKMDNPELTICILFISSFFQWLWFNYFENAETEHYLFQCKHSLLYLLLKQH